MLASSRRSGAVLFLGATLALLGFSLAPASVPTAPAAPATTDAAATAARFANADTTLQVADTRSVSAAEAAHHAMVASAIRVEGQDWLGTPYRWGGTTRRGIDCSAFVRQFVDQNLGIALPRTTASQRYEGVHIDRSELQAGDLVFFRRRGVRHVGVYLSDGEFIHASSSRGVTISNLSSSYWDRHYWMSRRILSEPSGRMPTPRSTARRDSSGVRG